MKHTRIHGMRIEKVFKNGNIAFTFKVGYFLGRERGRYVASTRVLKCPDYCGYYERQAIREQLNNLRRIKNMSEIEVWKTSGDKRICDAIYELLNAIGDCARRKATEDGCMELTNCIRIQHEILLSVIESLVKAYRGKLEHGIRTVIEEAEKEAEAKTGDADSCAG